uniref:WRKY19-like zinc finger domain-containing protein n=1 Tax=Rhizophora mucronata TaxID=61149 RepID=A0A2P2JVC6_RHIMU
MDMSDKTVQHSHVVEVAKSDNYGDTTLRLSCLSYGGTTFEVSENNLNVDFPNNPDDGCRLVLGLGPTPSAYSGNHNVTGTNEAKKSVAPVLCPKRLSSEDDSILKLGLSRGSEEHSRGFDYSLSETEIHSSPVHQAPGNDKFLIPVVDEGSTSAKRSGGYMPSLLLAPRLGSGKVSLHMEDVFGFGTKSHCHQLDLSHAPAATTGYSMDTNSEQATTTTSSEHRISYPKKCKYMGCTKRARGASGLCIGHGGGQRCQKPGCNKGAESRTAYCKAHGGGRRCQHLGCTKSAEGKTDFCIAHGGGRRCGFPEGCAKAARGKSGLCIKHGGGKRCKIEGCARSAEGQAGLCISHGGGRRCQYTGCSKGAQGSTMFCKAHGGGKRCIFSGCSKGAEGSTPLCKAHGGGKRCLFDGGGICPKSVHGGTNFCVAHGGGKRCVVPGCTKSARGRTDCCVRHGGGKRCKFENCGKSAQGSTNFCKAHGGGKRCTWGEGKCEKFARGRKGLCAAHSSKVQEQETGRGGLIGPGLFHGLVSVSSTVVSSMDNNYSSSGVSSVSDCIDSSENPAQRWQLIPPQVLVPSSMKSLSCTRLLGAEKQVEGRNGYGPETNVGAGSSGGIKNFHCMVPEGRVHGGGLMSLFGGNLKNAIDGM